MKKTLKSLLRIFLIIYTVYAVLLALFFHHIPAIIYLILIAVRLITQITKKEIKKFAPFLLVAALIPFPTAAFKDGGTVMYSAVLYDVIIYNQMQGHDPVTLKIHHIKGVGLHTLGFVPIFEYKYFEE